MIHIDWLTMMLGLAVGSIMGAAFFIGLAFGMRLALKARNPIKILALSAALRISGLLGVGWIVVGLGGLWAALGYATAFFFARFIATTFVGTGAPAGGAP
ncbi:ATP synthase subunit AtpR [Sulfitobacter sp. MF3-043]|uniref:ATP synthase subunit AtpR n=1 Tax=Sulfitobacter sediminivivens TaxID=3252902 RepID=UPI0036DAE427